jgi:hypothetical protein
LARSEVLCLICCFLLSGCHSRDADRKALALRVAQGAPLQSSPKQVLDYLDGLKIEHYVYERDTPKGNSISAIVRYDSSEWRVVYTSYGILFRFDDQDRFIGYVIHPMYTGP